jgi:inosose dehydratase
MELGHQTNTRGVVGHPVGVTSIKDLYYVSSGDTAACVREVAEAGFSGTELFDGNVVQFPGGVAALRALTDELGLAVVAVYSGANFIFPDILDEELWRISRAAEAAAALGAEHLVVGGGARRASGTVDSDYARLGAGLNAVVEIAARHGLLASYHPHLTTCVESRDEIDRVFAETEIRFCPDTGHLALGGSDNAELIRSYAGRIEYVHLKDYTSDPVGFVPLGEGELDVAATMGALEEVGYDGWIMVEADGFAGDPLEAAKTSRSFLTALGVGSTR